MSVKILSTAETSCRTNPQQIEVMDCGHLFPAVGKAERVYLFTLQEFSSLRLRVFGMRILQNFSSFHIDTPLLGQNAISKNAYNVVISSPRVIIFSKNIELFSYFPHIWSCDHAHFRFGRQKTPIFFKFDFLGNPLCDFRNFPGSCAPPTGPT